MNRGDIYFLLAAIASIAFQLLIGYAVWRFLI